MRVIHRKRDESTFPPQILHPTSLSCCVHLSVDGLFGGGGSSGGGAGGGGVLALCGCIRLLRWPPNSHVFFHTSFYTLPLFHPLTRPWFSFLPLLSITLLPLRPAPLSLSSPGVYVRVRQGHARSDRQLH